MPEASTDDRDPWWQTAHGRLVELAIGPALAFIFWAIVVLLTIFAVSTATVTGNPFTDFFVAFGAVGQVVFAFMVWRLGVRQFRFMQAALDRQARIDTFKLRQEALDEMEAVFTNFSALKKPVYSLSNPILRIKGLFGKDVAQIADQLMVAMDVYCEYRDIFIELEVDPEKGESAKEYRANQLEELSTLALRLKSEAYAEMYVQDVSLFRNMITTFDFDPNL